MARTQGSRKKLTDLESRFVQEYLIDLSGSGAVRRAGYSPEGANVTAAQLLNAPLVRDAIDKAMAERAMRTRIDADAVLRELLHLIQSDVGALFGEGGAPVPLRELPESVRRSIASYEVKADGTWRIKFWDKVKALELALRHLGLLRDKLDVGVKVESYAELVAKAVGVQVAPAPGAPAPPGAPSGEIVEAER